MKKLYSFSNARRAIRSCGFAMLLLSLSTTASLAQFSQLQKLAAPPANRQAEARFGGEVALDGNVMAVGARQDDAGRGAVYVYEKSGNAWQLVTRLTAPVRAENDLFGSSLALAGDLLVVGAGAEDEDATEASPLEDPGAAYVFKKTAGVWALSQKLVASDRSESDHFGEAVAIGGAVVKTIVVGASAEDHDANGNNGLNDSGSAYVFEPTGGSWTQTAKLVPSARASGDRFGLSLAVGETTIAVSAIQDDDDASNANPLEDSGAAYVFEKTAGVWTQTQKLVATSRQADAWFGFSLHFSGNQLLIGAIWEDRDASDANPIDKAGAAYVFEKTGSSWAQTQKLVASTRSAAALFGGTVAIDGTTLVVGSVQDDTDANGNNPIDDNPGAVFVFTKAGGTWSQNQKLVAQDRGVNDHFGICDLSGSTLVVGAYFDNDDQNTANALEKAGSAYVFESGGCGPAAFTGPATVSGSPACAGQTVGVTFAVEGCGFAPGNAFTAQLSSASGSFASPTNLPGLVVTGQNQVPIPANTPYGTGYRIRIVGSDPALTSAMSAAFTIQSLTDLAVAQFPTTPSKICQGEALPVSFSTTGTCPFPAGNVFTVQLSSSTGSFANPTTLGTATPGTVTFPASALSGLPAGTGYRVRIVSSLPATTSSASTPFEIKAPTLAVTPTVSGAPVCRGNAVTVSFSLPAGGCAFPNGNTFTAQLSSATGSFNNPTNLGAVVPGPSNVTIPAGASAGSGYRIRIVSSNPALTSSSSGLFQVKACGNSRLSAEEPSLVVMPNPVMGAEIRLRVSGMNDPEFTLTTTTGRNALLLVKTDGSGEFVLTPRQPRALGAGVYVLMASEGTTRLTTRVIVVE